MNSHIRRMFVKYRHEIVRLASSTGAVCLTSQIRSCRNPSRIAINNNTPFRGYGFFLALAYLSKCGANSSAAVPRSIYRLSAAMDLIGASTVMQRIAYCGIEQGQEAKYTAHKNLLAGLMYGSTGINEISNYALKSDGTSKKVIADILASYVRDEMRALSVRTEAVSLWMNGKNPHITYDEYIAESSPKTVKYSMKLGETLASGKSTDTNGGESLSVMLAALEGLKLAEYIKKRKNLSIHIIDAVPLYMAAGCYGSAPEERINPQTNGTNRQLPVMISRNISSHVLDAATAKLKDDIAVHYRKAMESLPPSFTCQDSLFREYCEFIIGKELKSSVIRK